MRLVVGSFLVKDLPSALIHASWEAGPLDLAAHGMSLGADYPEPIVDHQARERAIAAYESVT